MTTPTGRLRLMSYLAAQLDRCGWGGRKQGHRQTACSHSPQASCHMGRILERGHAAHMAKQAGHLPQLQAPKHCVSGSLAMLFAVCSMVLASSTRLHFREAYFLWQAAGHVCTSLLNTFGRQPAVQRRACRNPP